MTLSSGYNSGLSGRCRRPVFVQCTVGLIDGYQADIRGSEPQGTVSVRLGANSMRRGSLSPHSPGRLRISCPIVHLACRIGKIAWPKLSLCGSVRYFSWCKMSCHCSPNESGQFPRDGYRGLLRALPIGDRPILAVQTVLVTHAVRHQLRVLAGLSCLKFPAHPWFAGILPRRLNQCTATMGVAGFRDRSMTLFRPAAVFRGDHAEIRHELLGSAEASEVDDFGQKDHCAQHSDPSITAKCSNSLFVLRSLRHLVQSAVHRLKARNLVLE